MPKQALLFILIWVIGIIALMYFFYIVPGKKKNARVKQMHEAIAVGDEIATIGGIIGTVTERDGETLKILVDEKTGTELKIVIYAVQSVHAK